MIIHRMQQSSPEWHAIKLGKVSASRFKDVMAKGQGKTRLKYMNDLEGEIVEGIPAPRYFDKNMEHGILTEPEAREWYELITKCEVQQVGFIQLNDYIGVSPDGLIGDDGMLEIKCPTSSVHKEYMVNSELLYNTYKCQTQGQLWVSGRKWLDLMSFRPKRRHVIYTVKRDEAYIANLEKEVRIFVEELKQMVEKFTVNEF